MDKMVNTFGLERATPYKVKKSQHPLRSSLWILADRETGEIYQGYNPYNGLPVFSQSLAGARQYSVYGDGPLPLSINKLERATGRPIVAFMWPE